MNNQPSTGKSTKGSFWKSLPGIITAVAGLVTALTAAYITLRPGPIERNDPVQNSPVVIQQFSQQASYGGDCTNRPAGTVCVKFGDGFLWLVKDAITGRSNAGVHNGNKVLVAHGVKADYHHVSGTNLVRVVSR